VEPDGEETLCTFPFLLPRLPKILTNDDKSHLKLPVTLHLLMRRIKMFKVVLGLILFGFIGKVQGQSVSLSGAVRDSKSGQPLIHATIFSACTGKSIRTNEYGFFVISMPVNALCDMVVLSKGYTADTLSLMLQNDTTYDFELNPDEQIMGAVTITAQSKLNDIKSTRISVDEIKTKDIKYLPSLGGELDIIKVIQLLPGVQKGVEGQSGFQVRGGDADQNLILLDEATVYNVSHLFGFFSVFIPEAVENMEIYKGGFPAEYGGRLSSILDIRMRDGNLKKFSGSGGVGLLSSRITFEGPIVKDKASFIISARRTYIDNVLKLVGVQLPYHFYDINAKLKWDIDKRNKLFYTLYQGDDVLKFNQKVDSDSGRSNGGNLNFGFKLGNFTNTLRWNHSFNNRWFSNTSLIYTQFRYNVTGSFLNNNIYLSSYINDIGVKQDFTYFKNDNNTIKMGLNVINHTFRPNIVSAQGDITGFIDFQTPPSLQNLETAIYVRNEQNLGKIKLNYGARLSSTAANDAFYAGLEPRFAAAWDVTKYGALKIGLARMKQYLHLVSSSAVAVPTDLWYPVSKRIKPQNSNQYTIGYQHLLPKTQITLSAEAYYKTMNNLTEYREGAVLLYNNNYENELLQGKGNAYGMEFLLKKDRGRLYGWISYTLGYSKRLFADLNGGREFPAKYDRRHNLAVVANYKLSKRWEISSVWNYLSGSRFTAQIGQYFQPKPGLNGIDLVPVYSGRNEVRMSPSHRLDLNFILKPKREKRFSGEWYFSVYNTYNRAEPYSIRITADPNTGSLAYEQPGLFGTLISIAYNFKF
jgi:hypothetical protein